MENQSESLEKKLDKPDWKQWLPVYGIYQVDKDIKDSRPTLIDIGRGEAIFLVSATYQAVSIAVAIIGTAYWLYQLALNLI